MKKFLLRFFTWWNGQTFGTQLWTWLYGEFVGEDEFGNRYYRTRRGKIDRTLLMERRWVIYNGVRKRRWCRHPGTGGFTTRSTCRRQRRSTSRIPGRSRTDPTSPGRRPPAPDRFDPRAGPPAARDRRLQAVDARALMPPASGATSRLKDIPRGVWALGLVSMFMDISSEMIHALLPLYLVTVLGASMTAVGLIEGIAEATAMIVKIFSGALSDWLGKRKLLAAIGYGLAAFTKPVFPLATGLGWIVTARFVDRIGKGIRAPRATP